MIRPTIRATYSGEARTGRGNHDKHIGSFERQAGLAAACDRSALDYDKILFYFKETTAPLAAPLPARVKAQKIHECNPANLAPAPLGTKPPENRGREEVGELINRRSQGKNRNPHPHTAGLTHLLRRLPGNNIVPCVPNWQDVGLP